MLGWGENGDKMMIICPRIERPLRINLYICAKVG